MKYLALISLVFSMFLFTSCASVPYTLTGAPKDPKPLDPSVRVVVVNAASVPVLPFEYKYLGTIQTEASVGCSTGGTLNQLRELAAGVGANVIYVKSLGTGIAVMYTGVSMITSSCLTLLADFVYAEAPLITKWQEEEIKAEEEAKKKKE
jgi:hypothetical protein